MVMTEATEILHLSEAEMVELQRAEFKKTYAEGGNMQALSSHWSKLWEAWNPRHPERGTRRRTPPPPPSAPPTPPPVFPLVDPADEPFMAL